MATLTESPPPRVVTRKRVRRISAPVLFAVVAFHLLLGGFATVWVVSRYHATRKLTFRAGPKSPNPAERAIEHRVRLQAKQQILRAPPTVPQRVLTTGVAKITLPPLPEMQTAQAAPALMARAARVPTSAPPPRLRWAAASRTATACRLTFSESKTSATRS